MVPTQIDEDRADYSVADACGTRHRYSLLDAKTRSVLIHIYVPLISLFY